MMAKKPATCVNVPSRCVSTTAMFEKPLVLTNKGDVMKRVGHEDVDQHGECYDGNDDLFLLAEVDRHPEPSY